MKYRVHQYDISTVDTSDINLPEGAEIISGDIDGTLIKLWVLVDETTIDKQMNTRTFFTVETKEAFTVPKAHTIKFILTFQTIDNNVIHLFELKTTKK